DSGFFHNSEITDSFFSDLLNPENEVSVLLVGLPLLCSLLAHLHLLFPVCLLPSHLSPEHQTLGLYQMPSTHS
ncbi:hypothetical protein J6590_046363, partial [Homalodisca vitripennis]